MNTGNTRPPSYNSGLFIIKALVSLVALGWVLYSLRGLDWQAAWGSFSHISFAKIFACFFLVLVIYASRLFRLRLWTEKMASRTMSFSKWVDIYLKSIALGSITPARLGDFSRITLLAATGLDLKSRGKIVLQDKLTDTLYIPLGFCLTAATVAARFSLSSLGFWAAGLVFAMLFFLLSYWFGRSIGMKALLAGWGITVLGFGLFVVSNGLLFWAVNIELPLLDIAAIVLTVGIIASLPVSIGGLGIRESSLLTLLSLWGVAPEAIPVLLVWEFLLNMVFPVALYVVWQFFWLQNKNNPQ
jgi:uncharacterized membrane protein YbhN (UPF0104 family)